MKKCIIIGAGSCDVNKLKKQLVIEDGDLCIAADGGLDHLLEAGVIPDLVIGDMDSLKSEDALDMFPVRRLPVEKDDTDMLAAIKEGLASGYVQYEFYGAFGGRFDHTLANIQCLLYLLNRGARGVIYGDDVTVMLIKNERISFIGGSMKNGKRISVFAFGGDAHGVSEKGLKYVLDNVTVKQEFPIGVSNEFTDEDALIEVQNGMLLICSEYEKLPKWNENRY